VNWDATTFPPNQEINQGFFISIGLFSLETPNCLASNSARGAGVLNHLAPTSSRWSSQSSTEDVYKEEEESPSDFVISSRAREGKESSESWMEGPLLLFAEEEEEEETSEAVNGVDFDAIFEILTCAHTHTQMHMLKQKA
jgi:predicted glutamine amidotransferase